MPEFRFQEMFPHGEDTTPYRRLDGEWVSTDTFKGQRMLMVDAGALTRLAFDAVRDVSHLFRPGHLAQLRRILEDPEASANDRFVALNMLRNACVSAGGVLPMCQDTGTAIVVGKRSETVLTGGGDEEAISRGVFEAYDQLNLRYSQMAPTSFWDERNTGTNLPAQVELYSVPGQAPRYELLVMAKGGTHFSSHVSLLITVAATTICWVATAYLGPATDRAVLVEFYKKVRPFGPGWERIRREAGVTATAAAADGESIPRALLGWVAGCATIWSALFSVGNFLYGRYLAAWLLFAVFAVGTAALAWVMRERA